MADYQQRVAERIVQAREAKGYDREPFALRAGISPRQLGRIETGKSIPRLATLRKIAEAAGVPLTALRPDLEKEEDQIRVQLDRIEAKLDKLTDRLDHIVPGEPEEEEPGRPPMDVGRRIREGLERGSREEEAQRTRRRTSG